MSFADIEKNIGSLGQKARDGKITIEDLQGGTFTITNGGIIWINAFDSYFKPTSICSSRNA